MDSPKDAGGGRRKLYSSRKARNTFVTKSGRSIKIHRNLTEKFRAKRDAAARQKALRMAGMPKSFTGRFFYRLHPVRLYKYWFSREGGIMALKLTGIGIIAGFLILIGVFAYYRKDLPNLKDISGSNLGGSIRYYDRSGQTLLWEDYDAVKRIPVKDTEMSQYVKDATVAIEDKDFFKHGGFDVRGIARAGLNDVFGSGAKQGGSTITQQLVKLNNDWTNERTYTRKVKELILSVELERSYSKKEILTGYLNAAPYGNVQYGVEAASRDYFQKSAKDLTIAEAAFLAGIPKSPSYFSPYGSLYKEDPKQAAEDTMGRTHYIIDLMYDQGKITKAQRDEAKKVDVLATVKEPQAKFGSIKAPYFVMTVKEQLETRFSKDTVARGGWKVTTTLDLNAQNIAEEQVQKGLRQVQRQGGDTIAFAAEDVKTGQVVALVGGVDFNNDSFGKVNYARAKLSPGSSFKPYDYATMLENTTNSGAGSVLYDTKGVLPGYPCTTGVKRGDSNCAQDYDLRFPGPLTLRYALGGSRNVPAMKAMLSSDPDPQKSINKTIAQAKKLMTSPGTPEGEARGDYKCYYDVAKTQDHDCQLASAIGDGAYLKLDEHVHGYATLSRNGLNIPQTYIMKIEDSAGKTIDEWKPSKGVQAIRAEAAYIVDDMISDPNASYLASKPHRYKSWKFGFKTGTTNDSKDGWMMGMSTQYAAGVWVGYHDNTKEMTGFMENMTQPILTGWMNRAHENIKAEDRVKPSGIQTLPAYVVRTHVGVGSREPSPSTDLFPSWYKATKAGTAKQVIDVVSNKLATDCTPTRARKDVSGGGSANSLSSDRFVGAGGANTSEQDDIHKCDDTKPAISIISSSPNSIVVSVTAGTHPLSSDQFPGSINVIIDGQTVQSFPVSNAQAGTPMTLSFNYSGSGSKTITATVVDSVLYDASDESNPVDFAAGGSLNLSASRSGGGNTVNFSWTGGDGPYTVHYKRDTAASYSSANTCSSNGNSCNVSGLNSSFDYIAYVEDSKGNKSSDTSF